MRRGCSEPITHTATFGNGTTLGVCTTHLRDAARLRGDIKEIVVEVSRTDLSASTLCCSVPQLRCVLVLQKIVRKICVGPEIRYLTEELEEALKVTNRLPSLIAHFRGLNHFIGHLLYRIRL